MAESKPENDASSRIETVIVMALKNEISWKMLDSLLEELTPTIEKSKQVIKILLNELQTLQLSFQKIKCNCHKMIKSADTSKDSEQECNTEVGIIEPECQLEIENNISRDDKYTTSDIPIDNSFTASKSDNEVFGNRLQSQDLNNIALVEEFKDQLYTFVGNYDEIDEANDDNQLTDLNEDQDKAQKQISKQNKRTQFQCTICQKSFQKLSNLKIHARVHTGEVPFECKTCKKRFKQIGNLKTHEIIHTGEMPFECKTCKKRFNQINNLKRHELIHTGEVPFECKACKKRFNTSGSLKVHERFHKHEKPFICKTCDKGFAQSSHLKKHEWIHSGERPFICKTCGKGFTTSSDLKVHGRIHTGEKPYQCVTCKATFAYGSSLRLHLKKHDNTQMS